MGTLPRMMCWGDPKENMLGAALGNSKGWCWDPEGCEWIGEGKEQVGKQEIEGEPRRDEEGDGSCDGFLRDNDAVMRCKPNQDRDDGNDKEQQADGVSVGRGVWSRDIDYGRHAHAGESKSSRDSDKRKDERNR
jgi:hypothetical protein